MGSVVSFVSSTNKESNNESNSQDVAQIVSSINFSDSDDDFIARPKRGDPTALYVDGFKSNWDTDNLKTFLQNQNVDYTKAQKDKGNSFATIYFDSVFDRNIAYKILTATRFDNLKLYVVPLTKNFSSTQNKCKKLMNGESKPTNIVNEVTPWLSIDYSEQIRQKVFKYSKIFSTIAPTPNLIQILPVETHQYYNNDVELQIGLNHDRQIVVGFVKSNDTISCINNCVNLPEKAIPISQRIQKFVSKSEFPSYDRLKQSGFWKFVRIRVNSQDQVMLIFGIFGTISENIRQQLMNEFADIDSLYCAETKIGESFGFSFNLIHLHGLDSINETLTNDCVFPIYPTTIFPIFKESFEIILDQISVLAELDKKTVLVDVDAGYGLYSFPLSKSVAKVIAFESNDEMCGLFTKIQHENNITNVELRNGDIENMINGINISKSQKIVVLIHAPHCGIRKKSLIEIQRIPKLNSVVFVSTNAEKLVNDCEEIFLNPENPQKFMVDDYVGVDTNPHTDRATVVLTLKRK